MNGTAPTNGHGPAPRVLLVDDHQLLRQALRRAVEEAGFVVVSEAGDGEEAVRRALQLRPDIVVMDVTMPVLDGVSATERIHAAAPDIAVLVLTMHGEDDLKAQALRAGAVAFLTKDSAMHDVVATLRAIADGEELSPAIARSILRELEPAPTAAAVAAAISATGPTATVVVEPVGRPASPLTAREEEILQLIADGCSTTEVARQLFISGKTVKNHLASIYAKLDARDRTQAVLAAVRGGIVHLR
jgi:DNA-binding NarL/FixJ family response regulator